jgi:hypothetical protein
MNYYFLQSQYHEVMHAKTQSMHVVQRKTWLLFVNTIQNFEEQCIAYAAIYLSRTPFKTHTAPQELGTFQVLIQTK